MDARRLHDQFDYLPCWVRGTAQAGDGIRQREIRAGGTARIVPERGEVQLFGCDTCDEILTGDPASAK